MAELAPATADDTYSLGFAGDTFNTAWYLKQVLPSCNVAYFSAVGDDAMSAKMRASMTESGIDDSHLRTIPGAAVGLYMISLSQGERSFSYWRGQSAARSLADDSAALDRAMASVDLVYFSGITLGILDADARARLLDALSRARQAGKIIAFDPNLRPRLWASPSEMTEAIMQGAAVSDIALPSYEDEAEWFGDATPEATAARYADAGVVTVVVKNGAGPILYREGETSGVVEVDALERVVDTTAAGDSFNAGFFAGHAAGLGLREGIAQGCQLARHVVQHKGALVPVEAL